MFGTKKLTKEQILKAIEDLENNPHDKLGILADIGIGTVGAAGAGAAVAAFGGTIYVVRFDNRRSSRRLGSWRCFFGWCCLSGCKKNLIRWYIR